MTLYLKLQDFTYSQVLSPSQYFYLDIVDAKTDELVSQRKLYPRLMKNAVTQVNKRESLLLRVVYIQKGQQIDLQNIQQKVFAQKQIHAKDLVEKFQSKERQQFLQGKKQRSSTFSVGNYSVKSYSYISSDQIEYRVSFHRDEKEVQNLLSNVDSMISKYCIIKFAVKYDKKKDLIGRSHFPQVVNLFHVAKVCSVVFPNANQCRNGDQQKITSEIATKMLENQEQYDFRKTFNGFQQNNKVNKSLRQQLKLESKASIRIPESKNSKANSQNQSQVHNTYLQMYKGPCPSVNLFSVLDSRVEGQNRFNFIERLYRDKNSKLTLIKMKNKNGQLSKVQQQAAESQKKSSYSKRKQKYQQENTMRA